MNWTIRHKYFVDQVSEELEYPLLVLVCWDRAAGAKDYVFVETRESLESMCDNLPRATNLVVFTRKLKRSQVTKAELVLSAELVPKAGPWVLIEKSEISWPDVRESLDLPYSFFGDFRYELKEELDEYGLADLDESAAFELYLDAPELLEDSYLQTFLGDQLGAY